MEAKGDGHGLLLSAENGGLGLFGSHAGIASRFALAPFLDRGEANPVPAGRAEVLGSAV